MSHLMLKSTATQHSDSGSPGGGDQNPARMAGSLLLRAVPEDPAREGLLRTPDRFAKAFADLCSGYHITARDAVGEGIFPAEGQGLVAVRDIEFYSLCEHHMLPFWGTASVAYYPSGKILGLSKFPRLLDRHARRLQVQERLSESIADDIVQLIDPLAVVVQVRARHLCMMMRGVEKQNSETTTETVRKKPGNYVPDIQRLYTALEKR
jgi:GTP cyclohydrolase I